MLPEIMGLYGTPFTVAERTSPEILVQVPPTKGVVSLVESVYTVGLFKIVAVDWLPAASVPETVTLLKLTKSPEGMVPEIGACRDVSKLQVPPDCTEVV